MLGARWLKAKQKPKIISEMLIRSKQMNKDLFYPLVVSLQCFQSVTKM
jgi:hypothetical protein